MKKAYIIVLSMILTAVGLTGCKYVKPLDGPGMEREVSDSLVDRDAMGDSLNVVTDDAQKQDMESARAFVEQFYKGWGMDNVLDYDYPKKHITPKLLQFLADSYVVMLVSSSHARLLPATATMSLLRTST